MSDLISREAVKNELANSGLIPKYAENNQPITNSIIDRIPAVDAVEVVHAKWIRPTKISGRNFDIPHCSACHEVPCGADGNYCPNCGARMDGE